MPLMPVTESVFLVAESREHPMHVGGLHLLVPPDGETDVFGQQMFERLVRHSEANPLFRKRPGTPVSLAGTVRWIVDDEIDIEYHVRRATLPKPGRIRDLFVFISQVHADILDRYRPMWETYVIDGLDDGRVAVFTKIHHSLVDGVSALRLLERTLTPDPDARDCTAVWDPALVQRPSAPSPPPSTVATVMGGVRTGAKAVMELAGVGPAVARIGLRVLRRDGLVLPLQAPHSVLNVRVGGARRFAADQWSVERLRSCAEALGATLNDVVLAMCAGALRDYLLEQGALPEGPLIAMVPVSTRVGGSAGGNAVTASLCNLGTDHADPADRLAAVTASMAQSKAVMRDLGPLQALGYGAAVMAPLLLTSVPGFVRATPPPFNIIISNVPGPSTEMYWNGARLDGVYPASIVLDGQALNITVATTADAVNFGLVGCRRSVPGLQRILGHLEHALVGLEELARQRQSDSGST